MCVNPGLIEKHMTRLRALLASVEVVASAMEEVTDGGFKSDGVGAVLFLVNELKGSLALFEGELLALGEGGPA